MPAIANVAACTGAGVRKPPKEEIAGRISAAVAHVYGDLTAACRAIEGIGWGRACRALGLIRQNGLFG